MKKKYINIITYIVLSIWALITIYPFIWIVINSFKPSADILRNSFNLPFKNFTFSNYITAATGEYNIIRAYGNSLFISIIVVILVLLIAGLASFALARYNFKGKKIVYGFIIACMMFPIFSIIYPLHEILIKLGINGTRFGVVLPQVAGNVGFAVVILTGFMQQLPIEVEESAYIDGANVFQVLYHLVFPMAKPAFATTSIFVFLWSYNDLFLQMVVISDKDKMPISAILKEISSKYGTDFGLMAASVTLVIIPVLLVYILLQKHIIKGLTAGAIKG
ncbi:carbohydrate ABC transporter permease [Haploplasma axanthum]|uniref:Inner membrane ABC transporter permease protein ycjP n=1 Tax=Haploplasma axanthum TaxID=29552 RepID=A0A449BBL7_HAPAX|nr:carbohydrate ABC transporter permease [Haploplasma axanthum]VEU79829.1 Inner membrane ABC transporter permease protein ycjP [Haploplasma axanthum]